MRALIATTAEDRAELETLRAVVTDLARRVVALEEARRGPSDDGAFVRTIAAAAGASIFTCQDLIAHGHVNIALEPMIAGMSAKQIGKRLRTLAGRDLDGFTVTRIKRFWCVQPSCK